MKLQEQKLQNKTNLFTNELTKQNKRRVVPFLLRDREKVSISILLQEVCLDWKLSPVINRRGVGIRVS